MVLDTIYRQGVVRVSSNYAKKYPPVFAMLASAGYITTEIGPGEYSREWRLTTLGLITREDNT